MTGLLTFTCKYHFIPGQLDYQYKILCKVLRYMRLLQLLTFTYLAQNLKISGPSCTSNQVLLTCQEVIFTEIEWRNGTTIISNSLDGRYTFKNNHTILEIQNVTQYDNGSVFTCGDANNSSVISNPVTLIVYGEQTCTYCEAIQCRQLVSYVRHIHSQESV